MTREEVLIMLGFVLNLATLLKLYRDEKRLDPTVVITAEWKPVTDEMGGRTEPIAGMMALYLIVRTDFSVTDFSITYSMETNLDGYSVKETTVSKDAIYAGKNEEIRVQRFKVIPADAIRNKEFQAEIPIAFQYRLKAGKRTKRHETFYIERGSDKFQSRKT